MMFFLIFTFSITLSSTIRPTVLGSSATSTPVLIIPTEDTPITGTQEFKDKNTEVILVSLDFPSQIESKLKPYLKKNKIKSKVILLDDSKMNTWVPKVSEQWDGGIPATLIVNSSNYNFYPKPFEKEELYIEINKAINN